MRSGRAAAGWVDRAGPELRSRAEVTGGGELLWPRSAAGEVVAQAAAHGLAVVGGEVFAPAGGARALLAREWETSPGWAADEPWERFVERGAAQAEAVLASESDGDDGGRLYFVAVCDETEYRRQLAARDGAV